MSHTKRQPNPMVARISSGANPTGAVCYNEEKVEKGKAERLAIRNYEGLTKGLHELKLGHITSRLEEHASGNERVSKPTFHASLSLAQGERPSSDELISIADRYMDGMGYTKQPYVVYQHYDTDHTHIHIVSVRVDEEGKKLSDSYERERSNSLRQQIEKEFGLQIAERTALRPERTELVPIDYRAGDVKKEVSTIIQGILKEFTFSNLAQYNQLLGIYNVRATEVQIPDKKPGLVYSVVDDKKVSQGNPFKASSLPQKPTLETVTRRMNAGKKVKGDRINGVRKMATGELAQASNWDSFQQGLSRKGLETIPHFGKDGNLFGISFIDVHSRTLYTGSELGKSFAAGSLKTTLGSTYQPPTQREVYQAPEQEPRAERAQTVHQQQRLPIEQKHQPPVETTTLPNADLVRQLLHALNEPTGDDNEHELKKMFKRARTPNR